MKTTFKSAAIITIKDADKMTDSGRANLAAWLRKQAGYIIVRGPELASTFRARYLYEDS